jgi:hypothetical protein
MICDTIATYRIQLDPVGAAPYLDVRVRVDGPDLPDLGGNCIATIFLDRLIHSLSGLFGLDNDKVDRIREQLEAGGPVHIEVRATRTQLVQANLIQASPMSSRCLQPLPHLIGNVVGDRRDNSSRGEIA